MYNDIKREKRTKAYFLDAVKGAGDPKESRYFSQGLSLIGVYFDTPYLITSEVLAEPHLDVNLDDDIGLTVEITLKPEREDDPGLDILDLVLERTSMGTLHTDNVLTPEDERSLNAAREISQFIMPKRMSADTSNREVTLFFSEDSVNFQKFKMLGQNYYLFTLTETGLIGDEEYEHVLYVLFKDKDSSHETFFSGLVGETLDFSITKRVLESITDTNITGMFVGGTSTLSDTVRTTSYALSVSGIEVDDEGKVSIETIDSIIQFHLEDIINSEVKPTSAGKYTFIIQLKGSTTVYIYLG